MQRSYFKIGVQGTQLGLSLVNAAGQTFFLYGGALVAMWANQDGYVLVKRRNRDRNDAIAYHPGQILGAIERQADEASLCLFFSEADRDMRQDASRRLVGVVSQQTHTLPAAELEAVVKAFEAAHRNRAQFEELMLTGRADVVFQRSGSPA